MIERENDEKYPIKVMIAFCFAVVTLIGSTQFNIVDDMLPAPGTYYRGLPFAFLKGRPTGPTAPVAWEIRWVVLIVDFLVWYGVWHLIIGIFSQLKRRDPSAPM